MGHQITEWQPHKGIEFSFDKDESMHYNPLVDKQIRVPIGDINELRKKLKYGFLYRYFKGMETLIMPDNDELLTELNEDEKENGFTLTRKQKK